MVLSELTAYVPRSDDVQAGIGLLLKKPGGRAGRSLRPPTIKNASLWVLSRGWRASIRTDRNERERLNAANQAEWGGFPTGKWSQPMEATLTDLASKSPFRLGDIAEVLPGCPVSLELQCHPRLTVQRGIDAPTVPEEHLPRCSPREPRRRSRWQ